MAVIITPSGPMTVADPISAPREFLRQQVIKSTKKSSSRRRSRKRAEAKAKAQAEAKAKAQAEAKAKSLARAKAAATAKTKSEQLTKQRLKTLEQSRIQRQRSRQVVRSTLEPSKKQTFIQRQEAKSQELRTKKIRGVSSIKEEAALLGLAALSTVVNFGKDIIELPKTVSTLIKNPSLLKKLPSAIKQSGREAGVLLRTSPGEAFVKVGTEIYLLKGQTKVLNSLGKLTSSQLARLSPKFVGKANIGKTLSIRTPKGKSVNLKVVGKIPKEKLGSQVNRAGKKLTAISSQADELLGFLKGKKLLRKPIPGESGFNKATKDLLKRFDTGKLSQREVLRLDSLIKKQGAKGLLERSFFADPTGKIRPSRLGIQKDKGTSLLDLLTEDITFKRPKPQILLFEDIRVQKLPTNLKSVGNKLKRGAALTKKEADNLLKFQLKKSNKFKPVGFVSGESEVTLPPGEILKKVKKVGITIVDGKRVPIIKTEVFKPTGRTKTLLNKFNKGKATRSEIKILDSLLKKKTGFNYGLSSSKKIGKKFIDIKRIGVTSIKKARRGASRITGKTISKKPVSKKAVSKKVISKKPVSKKTTSKRKRISKRISRKSRSRQISKRRTSKPVSRKRISKSISRKRISKPISRKSISKKIKKPVSRASPSRPRKVKRVARLRFKKKKRIKKRKKRESGYNVFARPLKKRKGQRRPKLVKVNKVPLRKKRAKDLRNYITDTSLARTAKITKSKLRPKKPKLKAPRGYAKKTSKKFRRHRIIKGKRRPLPKGKVIEKRTRLLDTRQEKKKIGLRRRIKQLSKPKKRKIKRRVSKPRRKTIKRVKRRVGTIKSRTKRRKINTRGKPTQRKRRRKSRR